MAPYLSVRGAGVKRKEKSATQLRTWPYVVRLTVTLSPYLSPLNFVALDHLSILGPRQSTVLPRLSTAGNFSLPDFVEIYEPPRSDGLTDSLGGRASRPARKIVPYVYLKSYTRQTLLVTSLISMIDVSWRHFQIREFVSRVYDGWNSP